jgi:hypothetical protein
MAAKEDLNATIAARLHEVADLLEAQDANPFRVRAYRDAASTIEGLDDDVADLYDEGGVDALKELPNIGESIAGAVAELRDTGKLGLLERLRGETDPVSQLAQLPGIGDTLAKRVHEQLDVETLPELETALHDGRLERVEGFGEKRIEALKAILDTRLRRGGRDRDRRRDTGSAPPVGELLDVDREYRTKAEAGELRTIAPRRFNPEGESWLPILHTERDDRSYTVLYCSTARAHGLGKTRDWVVMYVEDDGERQYTAVTSQRGDLRGKRVIRGREDEVREYYARRAE